ncbi:MAG: SDR family oxidoreductase [Acidobacteriota bacterium]|nr:SDR family oxidoreductase [Acidobacteriota bacterium]
MKTAIVTGASRGIGRAIALELGKRGMNVLLTARDLTLLEDVEREIGHARVIALDLRLPESPAKVVESAVHAFGGVDVLVNNAGATKRGDFEALTEEDWQDGYALKFFGAVRMTRAAWPHLRQSGGSLINIAGSGGRTPGAEFAIGGSVNAALLSFTKAMADAGLRDGVQVNAINPGPVRTARLQTRLEKLAAAHNIPLAEALQLFMNEEKIMKIGEPEDIAEMVAFMVSNRGRYMHGSLIDMDGGLTKTI